MRTIDSIIKSHYFESCLHKNWRNTGSRERRNFHRCVVKLQLPFGCTYWFWAFGLGLTEEEWNFLEKWRLPSAGETKTLHGQGSVWKTWWELKTLEGMVNRQWQLMASLLYGAFRWVVNGRGTEGLLKCWLYFVPSSKTW